jgi:ubiquinone/menaquinone biosynthesis C-methylase UbiE
MQSIEKAAIPYMISVGEADRKRLDALGATFNPTSMEIIIAHTNVKNPKILDVGCGNGCLTNMIAKTLKGCQVVGVDISQEQLDTSKKTAAEENLTNISWELCDVYKLNDLQKKHPELFDVVHSRFVLTHVQEPEKAADQMLSMVKPGGVLIIEESGDRKKFKGTPPKCIEAWIRMVRLQYQMQKSYKDTCDRVYKHLQNSDQISSCRSELFDFVIEGQLKKSLFRMGAEQGLKKFEQLGKPEIIKMLGYEDGKTWIEELTTFENDDSITLEVESYESLIAIKS